MESKSDSSTSKRKIPEIEGLRSVAILMVLFFHFFARWTPPINLQNIYPYKFEIARQISQFGYMGVQLFFMISGFVILRSLEAQTNFLSYAKARTMRIYPSLVLAIPLLYVTCNVLNLKFIAPIPLSSLIPSLTLLAPTFLNQLFSTQFVWTTGVLWSLFIEVQFYVAAGAIFFTLKKCDFLKKLLGFSMFLQFLSIFLSQSNHKYAKIFDALIPLHHYIWWFLAGSTYYKLINSSQSKILLSIIGITIFFNIISINYEKSSFKLNFPITTITIIFYLIFFLLTTRPSKVSFLRSTILVWLGGLSYEFYLIHESLGISIVSKMKQLEIFPDILGLQIVAISLTLFGLVTLSLALKKCQLI